MNWDQILIAKPIAVAVPLLFAGISALVAGVGYRRLGWALGITFVASVGVTVAAAFIGVFVGLAVSGRGEGAGVAALLMAVAAGAIGGLSTLVVGAVVILTRRQRVVQRTPPNRPLMVAAFALLLASVGVAGQHVVSVTPSAQSSGRLASQSLATPNGPLREESRAALVARGQAAVPEVIAALRQADEINLREFENGLSTGVMMQFDVLGELGGPQSIAELRVWLNSDYAPDIRAAAAQALGEAGDAESAHAIALLLEDSSYEWKKCRVQLLYALRLLKAKEELPYVKAAMQFAPDEEGRSYQIEQLAAGIQTLVVFDTPEAWKAIEVIANANGDRRRQAVQRTLESMGKSLPEQGG